MIAAVNRKLRHVISASRHGHFRRGTDGKPGSAQAGPQVTGADRNHQEATLTGPEPVRQPMPGEFAQVNRC
jgi:hypothetical protein